MGGLAQAFADNIPILYLPGGSAVAQTQVRPNFSPARTYATVSKHSEVVYQPDMVSSVMRRAFHNLRNGRPGPVVVELPGDVSTMEVSEGALNYQPPKRHPQLPSSGDVSDAVKALLSARKPMIWSGMGVLMAGASADLQEFAELTEIPVYCTMPGKSGFNERHPLALGSGSGATTEQARHWLRESDVLFGIGSSLSITSYGQPIPPGKVMIHNTESIEDINKDFSVDIGVPGDTKLTLRALIDEVKAQLGDSGRMGKSGVVAEISDIRRKWMADWTGLLNSDETPISTYRVIGELERVLDHDNSIVTHDAGAPRDSIMPFYTATTPHSYIGWGKTTHLGYGIPLMIGAKLANRTILPQLYGRRRFRDVRVGHRNGGARGRSDNNRSAEQRRHGYIPRRLSHGARAFRRNRNDRRLRQDSRRNGRGGHHRNRSQRSGGRHTPSAEPQRRRPRRTAGRPQQYGTAQVKVAARR